MHRLTLALFAPVATLLSAQQPERATFVMLRGADTVVVERSTRTPTRLEGELLVPSSATKVAFGAALTPAGLMTSFQSSLSLGGATAPATTVTLSFQGDSVIANAAGQLLRIRAGAGALPYASPSLALLEQALIRAKAIGGPSATIPFFFLAGGATVPVTITWLGADSATLDMANVVMRLAVSPSGRLLGGAVPSQGARIVRGMPTGQLTVQRPDYTAPPGAPYTAQDVTIKTSQGLTLAGTLTIPKNARGRLPAVVTITGSGIQDRDEGIPTIGPYKPFQQLADTLSRRGIAVLRLDDRGIGGSDAGPPGATSADFAGDIRAGIAYLRRRSDIDPDRIALVGHSEGGLIAPMVAAADPRVRAIVVMAGPSQTGRQILEYQNRYSVDSMARMTGPKRDSLIASIPHALDSVSAANPWMRFFMEHDPLATARAVHTPVLILQGATDRQVSADQANVLAAAFRAGGNRDVTVRVFPETNHLFVADPSGNPTGYAALPSKQVRSEVLGAIADWLTAHF